MSDKKIWICDDETEVEQNWKEKLEGLPGLKDTFDIETAIPDDLLNQANALEERRKKARGQTNPLESYSDDRTVEIFDDADILIVDYDLISLNGDSYWTGENIAYLARCYSSCGLIVALNQFDQEVTFDLTLKDHPDSFADLNISQASLADRGLWCQSDKWGEFRPWYWPCLPEALNKFERRIADLREKLEEPILDYLGFTDPEFTFPRSMIEFLTVASPDSVNFEDFVLPSSGKSAGNGLRRKDRPFSRESIVRIAAARIAQWLDCIVLPGQNILVDAPHLIVRYPSLLEGNADDIETWDKAASLGSYDALGVSDKVIRNFRFKCQHWLSRPAWLWSDVSNCEDIQEVKNPWATNSPDCVFCEDTSRFAHRNDAKEFVADLDSPFIRRFAKEVKGVKYKPRVRFSM